MKNPGFFDEINSEPKAYWLGFIAADGHLNKCGKQVTVCLSSRDHDHLEVLAGIFEKAVKKSSHFDKRTGKTYSRSVLAMHSKGMHLAILSLLGCRRKTEGMNGHVFSRIPRSLIRHFARGYFDGDGCISKIGVAEYRVSVAGTMEFLTSMRLSVSSQMQEGMGVIIQAPGVCAWQFGGSYRLIRFREWMYAGASVFLGRKKLKFDMVPSQRGMSRFNGVSFCRTKNKWIARVSVGGRRIGLGSYESEEAAMTAIVVGMDTSTPSIAADFVR